MIEIKKIVYQTIDGKIFPQKNEAEEYEKKMIGKRYFLVYSRPDLTEGRYDARPNGYIIVDALELSYTSSPIPDAICKEYAEAWCEKYISVRKYTFAACPFHAGGPFHNWKVEQLPTDFEKLQKYTGKYKLLGTVDECGFNEK